MVRRSRSSSSRYVCCPAAPIPTHKPPIQTQNFMLLVTSDVQVRSAGVADQAASCQHNACNVSLNNMCVLMQLYEQLYWENYDNTEQNRIEVNKQARKEALQQAADANKDPEEELAPELQHGSGYTNLAGRVSYNSLVSMHTFVASRLLAMNPSTGRGVQTPEAIASLAECGP